MGPGARVSRDPAPTDDSESRGTGGGARCNTARRCTGRVPSRIPDRRRSARSACAGHAPRPIWLRSAGTGLLVRNQRERPERSPPGMSGTAVWSSCRLGFQFADPRGSRSRSLPRRRLWAGRRPAAQEQGPGLHITVTGVAIGVFGPKAVLGYTERPRVRGRKAGPPEPCCNGYGGAVVTRAAAAAATTSP
jgi:hypothetical protein